MPLKCFKYTDIVCASLKNTCFDEPSATRTQEIE